MPLNFASRDAGRPHVLAATLTIVDRYQANATFTSIDLPPRSGKSSVIHLSSLELSELGAPWVIAVAPWTLLPDQLIEEDKVKDTIRRYCGKTPPMGVAVDRIESIRHHRFYEREGISVSLYAATLSLMYRNEHVIFDTIGETVERLQRRPVIMMDEAHLCSAGPKGNKWGSFIERAAEQGAYVVCLTGTRVRADGQPVPGFQVRFDERWNEQQRRMRSKEINPKTGEITHYIDTLKVKSRKGEQESDYKMTWQEAWEKGFLNQVNILWADAEIVLDGETRKVSDLPAEVANKCLRQIVDNDKIIAEACRLAVGKLYIWRKLYKLPKTKMLVTTGSDLDREQEDNYHARKVRRALELAIAERFPAEEAARICIDIATSTNTDDDRPNKASRKIGAFRGDRKMIDGDRDNEGIGEIDVIIVKSMGLVGLDVPELKVQLCLSTLRDGPMMLQERSRALTIWSDAKALGKPSDLIMPCDKANQSLIEKMRDAGGIRDVSSQLLGREEVEPNLPKEQVIDFVRVWLAKVGDHTGVQIECDDTGSHVVETIRDKFESARALTDVMLLKCHAEGAFPLDPSDLERVRRLEELSGNEPVVVNLQNQTKLLRGQFGKRARALTSQVIDHKINQELYTQAVAALQGRAKELAGVNSKVDHIDDPVILQRSLDCLEIAFKELLGSRNASAS